MSSPKVWLITGTSSGFGRCMTEYALSQGDIMVETLLKPEVLSDLVGLYSANKLFVLKVDVTKQEDIDEASTRTCEVFERLDVVFNNAGYGLFTEVEDTPVDKAHEMFETNFRGSTNVSRAAVKFFREVNEPSSTLEDFSDGLAKELLPSWNIKALTLTTNTFVLTTRTFTRSASSNRARSAQTVSTGDSYYRRSSICRRVVCDFCVAAQDSTFPFRVVEGVLTQLSGPAASSDAASTSCAPPPCTGTDFPCSSLPITENPTS
ncbi:hypothetical protein DFH29DRAFT_1030123 [Suillus ampliporus]|nr:hypothetical protein DFH29DRAFT_1030123 [Suillus ampliporus]